VRDAADAGRAAEATGLSVVQVKRTLQELRRQGLIALRGKELTVPDLGVLQDAAQFNPNYLHLGPDGPVVTGRHGTGRARAG